MQVAMHGSKPFSSALTTAVWPGQTAALCCVLHTQTMPYSSAEGSSGLKTYQRSRGPSASRALGRSHTSSQAGELV